jgi:hypothetical protein
VTLYTGGRLWNLIFLPKFVVISHKQNAKNYFSSCPDLNDIALPTLLAFKSSAFVLAIFYFSHFL